MSDECSEDVFRMKAQLLVSRKLQKDNGNVQISSFDLALKSGRSEEAARMLEQLLAAKTHSEILKHTMSNLWEEVEKDSHSHITVFDSMSPSSQAEIMSTHCAQSCRSESERCSKMLDMITNRPVDCPMSFCLQVSELLLDDLTETNRQQFVETVLPLILAKPTDTSLPYLEWLDLAFTHLANKITSQDTVGKEVETSISALDEIIRNFASCLGTDASRMHPRGSSVLLDIFMFYCDRTRCFTDIAAFMDTTMTCQIALLMCRCAARLGGLSIDSTNLSLVKLPSFGPCRRSAKCRKLSDDFSQSNIFISPKIASECGEGLKTTLFVCYKISAVVSHISHVFRYLESTGVTETSQFKAFMSVLEVFSAKNPVVGGDTSTKTILQLYCDGKIERCLDNLSSFLKGNSIPVQHVSISSEFMLIESDVSYMNHINFMVLLNICYDSMKSTFSPESRIAEVVLILLQYDWTGLSFLLADIQEALKKPDSMSLDFGSVWDYVVDVHLIEFLCELENNQSCKITTGLSFSDLKESDFSASVREKIPSCTVNDAMATMKFIRQEWPLIRSANIS